MKTDAKIFVTDYQSYNEGNQFKNGHWVELDQFSDIDELKEYLENHFNEIGISDPEIMLTDFEGFPKKFYLESYDSKLMEELFEYFDILEDCHNPEAMEAYISEGYDYNDFDEAYSGEFDSDEDFAQDLADQLECIDQKASWPQTCIDWELAAREIMYDYHSIGNFYFRNL